MPLLAITMALLAYPQQFEIKYGCGTLITGSSALSGNGMGSGYSAQSGGITSTESNGEWSLSLSTSSARWFATVASGTLTGAGTAPSGCSKYRYGTGSGLKWTPPAGQTGTFTIDVGSASGNGAVINWYTHAITVVSTDSPPSPSNPLSIGLSSPSPSPPPSPSTPTAGCTPSTLSSTVERYECMHTETDFELHWASTGTSASDSTRMAIVGATVGYVALGFSTDGAMVGSQAVIGWVDSAGSATVGAFDLTGKSASGVVSTAAFSVGSTSGSETGGKTSIHFVVSHADAPTSFNPSGTVQFLYALGSSDALAYHRSRGSFALSLANGAAVESVVPFAAYKWQLYHGLLMFTAWGIMLPMGAFVARFMKVPLQAGQPAKWYRIHRLNQTVGVALALVGVLISLSNSSFGILNTTHGYLGLVVMSLGLLQPINAVLRPHRPEAGAAPSSARRTWQVLHKGVGYAALALAIVVIFMGLDLFDTRAGRSGIGVWRIIYLCYLALLVILAARYTMTPSVYGDGQQLVNSPPPKLSSDV